MLTDVEAAIRATRKWIMVRFYGSALPAPLSAEYALSEVALTMASEATPRGRAKLARAGLGVETLKNLQFAIEDAGLWPSYGRGAPELTGRPYDLAEGLAIARAL